MTTKRKFSTFEDIGNDKYGRLVEDDENHINV